MSYEISLWFSYFRFASKTRNYRRKHSLSYSAIWIQCKKICKECTHNIFFEKILLQSVNKIIFWHLVYAFSPLDQKRGATRSSSRKSRAKLGWGKKLCDKLHQFSPSPLLPLLPGNQSSIISTQNGYTSTRSVLCNVYFHRYTTHQRETEFYLVMLKTWSLLGKFKTVVFRHWAEPEDYDYRYTSNRHHTNPGLSKSDSLGIFWKL